VTLLRVKFNYEPCSQNRHAARTVAAAQYEKGGPRRSFCPSRIGLACSG
jgi:hypothetical protein